MKKVLLFVVAAALVSGTMVSCGKSSKGKMDGEWKLDSMTMTNSETSGGCTDTEVTSIDGTTFTSTQTNCGVSSPATTGTVTTATWTISKDGTWERVLAMTITGTGYTQTQNSTSSGNWDFAAGVGEFKKNERVIFSTTSESNTSTFTPTGGSTSTSTSSNTYLDGENTEVFVITESKGKSLSMEAKGSNTYTGGSTSTYTSETTVKMSL